MKIYFGNVSPDVQKWCLEHYLDQKFDKIIIDKAYVSDKVIVNTSFENSSNSNEQNTGN